MMRLLGKRSLTACAISPNRTFLLGGNKRTTCNGRYVKQHAKFIYQRFPFYYYSGIVLLIDNHPIR